MTEKTAAAERLALMEDIGAEVREYVVETLAPLIARIEALEAKAGIKAPNTAPPAGEA